MSDPVSFMQHDVNQKAIDALQDLLDHKDAEILSLEATITIEAFSAEEECKRLDNILRNEIRIFDDVRRDIRILDQGAK